MAQPPTSLLLLGGAGLPTWVWDGVRSAVDTLVAPITPALPRTADTSLGELAEAAAAAAEPGPIAVVAHSSGGCVAAELVARHPGRVTAILGLSAVVPRPGQSFVQTMPYPARLFLGLAARAGKTRPPERAIRTGLAAGIPDNVTDRLIADFEPEPRGLFLDRCSDRIWPAARGYVLTTRDRELPTHLQRASARRLGATPEQLETGHLPMLENPIGVAAAIERLLDQIPSNGEPWS